MHYAVPPPPSDDKRWKMVNATMRRLAYRPDALIETLHSVQENFGHLDREALEFVARALRVPLSRVFGVATFYHFFSLDPLGEHCCILCTGTACYIEGVPAIEAAMRERYGISVGQTTADGKLSLQAARCLGACGQAPVAVFDDELVGKLTAEDAVGRTERLVGHADD